jgi:uncharacterized protein (TIGR03437 family)
MRDLIRTCARWSLPAAALLAAGITQPAEAAGPLQIVTNSLPDGAAGVFYSQQLAVTGGSCPATGTASSTIDSGALPAGLSVISPAGVESWMIQGVPAASGSFQFALHIRWTHHGVSPFDRDCTDEAVQTLTILIQAPQTPLTVDRTQVNTTYHIAHFPPPAEIVQVRSGGSGTGTFTVQAATNNGGSWLSVTPLTASTPASLSISFSISGLQPGVYTGTVTLTSGSSNPVVIGVSLTVVVDSGVVLKADPPSLAFSFVTGGASVPAQSFNVTVAGDAVIFLADVSAPPNGKWLSVSPAGAATPATLTVLVDPKGLSPSTYNGTITLHLSGLSTAAQTIPVTFTVQAPPVLPAITPNGVVNAANLTAAISPGTWVSIFGTNLSATTRSWRDTDFVAGKLPTALDNVSVTIDGKAAAVAYVSPTQINVLAPDDPATGLVSVQVKAPGGTTNTALVLEQTAAPALFQFKTPAVAYVAGTHADGSYLAGAALVQQGVSGTPAKPGETIVIYGTGFGATQPPISATALVPAPLPLANLQELRVRVGGVDAEVRFAGLITPGLYQFNLVVPEVPDGDRTIVAELRGLLTRADLMVAVQH